MILLVDTNVAVLANETIAPPELEGCQEVAIDLIEAITRGEHILVVDDGGEIYEEYLHDLNPFRHQPGVGDAFVKWVFDHQWMDMHCQRVPITVTSAPNAEISYAELPSLPDVRIDPSDRKFIAACCAHAAKPPIFEAIDSKWWGWKAALAQKGIQINFLCPDYVRTKYEQKFPEQVAPHD